MGQYYQPTSLTKNQHVHAHKFDNGLKLMEHSYFGNKFVEAVEKLLSPGGAWHKDIFAWVGDYSDLKTLNDEGNVYGVSTEVEPSHITGRLPAVRYAVNWDLQEAVLISKDLPIQDEGDWKDNDGVSHHYINRIHPLPLLTSAGNGQGGGDYEGTQMDMVGLWAGHSISVESELPQGFTLITPNFKEN